MKLWESSSSSDQKISFSCFWWIPALAPLIIIVYCFATGTWSWGLMDDLNMISRPGGVWQRFSQMHSELLTSGRFFPAFSLHCALFYKIFANNPPGFFIFRFIETILALSLWGILAYRVTGKRSAVPILFAVTLSFYKFYDAFFFLSTQEILGILFSGAAFLCLIQALDGEFKGTGNVDWLRFSFGGLFFLLAFTSKEPFVSLGAAFGVSLIGVWLKQRKAKKLLILGLAFFFFSAAYLLILKIFVAKGYSAGYSLMQWDKIGFNVKTWGGNVLRGHAPWIALAVLLSLVPVKNKPEGRLYPWALVFSALAYIFFLLIILPWSGWGHYITPLGVFFAFGITIFTVQKLEVLPPWILSAVLLSALGLNIGVGGSAIYYHASYQNDTGNLAQWLSENLLFEHEVLNQGSVVRCNAQEPCEQIPKLVQYQYNKSYPPFTFTPQVKEILRDPKTKYYVWGTQWGDQDLRRLGQMWTPMFVSKHWVVFRRMY